MDGQGAHCEPRPHPKIRGAIRGGSGITPLVTERCMEGSPPQGKFCDCPPPGPRRLTVSLRRREGKWAKREKIKHASTTDKYGASTIETQQKIEKIRKRKGP